MDFEPRFGPIAGAYQAYRPAYPQALFDRILEALPPKNRRRAIDLGAGTGLSTLPLCRWFAEVVAVEPDPQMVCSSTSYGSAYIRTLSQPDAYLQELESRFQRAHPDDMIPVDFCLELILARKT
jgi:trans-aconitate methyltransferase